MQSDPGRLLGEKHFDKSQVPSWLLLFSFLRCNGVCLALSCPPSLYFTWTLPFSDYGFPFDPPCCFSWPLASVSTHSVPQSSQSFGMTIFLLSVSPQSSSMSSPSSSLYHYTKQRSLAAGQRNEAENEHATWKALSFSSQHSSERVVISLSRKLGKSFCSLSHISET